jgi:hypothetical protein
LRAGVGPEQEQLHGILALSSFPNFDVDTKLAGAADLAEFPHGVGLLAGARPQPDESPAEVGAVARGDTARNPEPLARPQTRTRRLGELEPAAIGGPEGLGIDVMRLADLRVHLGPDVGQDVNAAAGRDLEGRLAVMPLPVGSSSRAEKKFQ